jgi:nucleotidyltransferase AbiEii toxin of type IV toxin-antitoxin system
MLHHETIEPGTLDLIKGIMAIPLPVSFHLVGGTALALQIGYRLSYDIDFFSDPPLALAETIALIEEKYPVQIVRQNKGSAILTVEGIKTDLVSIQGNWIKPPVISEGIIMAELEDIATMKLLAITTRGRKRDFFDLYFLLKHFTLRHLTELFQEKFKRHELFMLTQSLVYFEDAENDEKPNLLNEQVSWKEVKEKIMAEVRIFHG